MQRRESGDVDIHYWIGGDPNGTPVCCGTDFSARSSSATSARLKWFYDGGNVIEHAAFTPDVVDEYLRTFSGTRGVLAAMGVYRAAFTSIAQTTPLLQSKVRVPVVAIGGSAGLGEGVGRSVALVAETVTSVLVSNCGHFIPEERPDELVRHVLATTNAQSN